MKLICGISTSTFRNWSERSVLRRLCVAHGQLFTCQQNEGDTGQPDVSEGGVLHLGASLGRGLEGDGRAHDLRDDCPPAGLHVGPPQQLVGNVGKPERLQMPAAG